MNAALEAQKTQIKSQITILVPVFNEQTVIPLFFERMHAVIQKLSSEFDPNLIFINNNSTDNTLAELQALKDRYPFVFIISLAKNVGYQRSLECGLRNARGDLFVFIDVDGEDPPEMILDFVKAHKEGFDIVYGERVDREEVASVKFMRKVFYHVTRAVADDEIVLDMAEFSLMTSEVRDAIIQDSSSFPFIRASIGRVGFRRKGIPYKRKKRIAGNTHYNFIGMTKFAIAGILSSTTLFLRLPVYLFPAWFALMVALTIFLATSTSRWALPLFLFSGMTYASIVLAFLSIYVARIYKNTLGRPNAVIDRRMSAPQPARNRADDTQSVSTQANRPQSAGPESAGPESAGPESAGPESAGPESARPESADEHDSFGYVENQ